MTSRRSNDFGVHAHRDLYRQPGGLGDGSGVALSGVVLHQAEVAGPDSLGGAVAEAQLHLSMHGDDELAPGAIVPAGHRLPAKHQLLPFDRGEAERARRAHLELLDMGLPVAAGIDAVLHAVALSALPADIPG